MIEQIEAARGLGRQLAGHLVLLRDGADVPPELAALAGALCHVADRQDALLRAALAGGEVNRALCEQLGDYLAAAGAVAQVAAERLRGPARTPAADPEAGEGVRPTGYATHTG